jgi:hypothetical protein
MNSISTITPYNQPVNSQNSHQITKHNLKKMNALQIVLSLTAAVAIGKIVTIGSFVATGIFFCSVLPLEALFAIPVVIGVISAVTTFFLMKKLLSVFEPPKVSPPTEWQVTPSIRPASVSRITQHLP